MQHPDPTHPVRLGAHSIYLSSGVGYQLCSRHEVLALPCTIALACYGDYYTVWLSFLDGVSFPIFNLNSAKFKVGCGQSNGFRIWLCKRSLACYIIYVFTTALKEIDFVLKHIPRQWPGTMYMVDGGLDFTGTVPDCSAQDM